MTDYYNDCLKIYNDNFFDGTDFGDDLFELFFETNCEFEVRDNKAVAFLFALDVFYNQYKGKYIFAVATDEKYRNKGIMSELLNKVKVKFSNEYDFLITKPSDVPLYDYYSKFGFTNCFSGEISTVYLSKEKKTQNKISLTSPAEIKMVMKKLVRDCLLFDDKLINFQLKHYKYYTDSVEQPTFLAVCEFEPTFRIAEFFGDKNNFGYLLNSFSVNNCEAVFSEIGSEFGMICLLSEIDFPENMPFPNAMI